MRARAIGLLGAVSLLGAAGCAATPKPKEIVALEDLRRDPTLSEPDRRAFDLLAAADALLVQASRAWEHHDSWAARRDALMGQIKMKTALALLQAEHASSRLAELDAELAISQDEAARLDTELLTAREEVALLERLKTAKAAVAAERKALSEQADVVKRQLATERQKAAAQHGVRVLELTLKIAETVDAARYAKAAYTAATAMLQDAHKELDAGRWDEALARATLAQAEAEKGIALARPSYEKASQALSNRARDRELEADATGIAGVETRVEREGDLQRLVLVFPCLFGGGQSALRPERAKVVEAVKELLDKYPTYPVQLVGYAAPPAGGKSDAASALSLARANAVYWALVGQGVDPKRMSVDGRLAAGPPSLDGRAAAGPPSLDGGAAAGSPSVDGRVELAILYHSTGPASAHAAGPSGSAPGPAPATAAAAARTGTAAATAAK